MNIIEKENGIILENVADFDPKHIFECVFIKLYIK